MSSPHINADPGAFAGTVLLPGDPLRARHVATTLLDNAVEVTDVRNMLGYTGSWKGQPVSVMGGGMGIPSTLHAGPEEAGHVLGHGEGRQVPLHRLLRSGDLGVAEG